MLSAVLLIGAAFKAVTGLSAPEGDGGARTVLRLLIYLPVFLFCSVLIIQLLQQLLTSSELSHSGSGLIDGSPVMKFSLNHYSIDELYRRPMFYWFLFDCACAAAMAGVLALTQPLLREWKRWCFVLSVSLIAPLSFGRAWVVLLILVPHAIWFGVHGAIFALIAALWGLWLTKPIPAHPIGGPSLSDPSSGLPSAFC
ncbi:MAG: hypothetical protein LBR29_02795 [Methylobacteriaceae bacterium]|nr:hypothetical protein [Methylobacteriaceae bacterium]